MLIGMIISLPVAIINRRTQKANEKCDHNSSANDKRNMYVRV